MTGRARYRYRLSGVVNPPALYHHEIIAMNQLVGFHLTKDGFDLVAWLAR